MPPASRTGCPAREELERAAAGVPGEGLATHLQHCETCRTAVAQISAENEFLREVAGAVRERSPLRFESSAATTIPGYTILGEIRGGGQGVVYRALQRSTKREVAIKVMREGALGSRTERARFEREVEILAGLNHPHIVNILDSGSAAGCHYFVMDLVRGEMLDEHIARRDQALALPARAAPRGHARAAPPAPALPPDELQRRLRLFATICEAVNAAHLRGVIHRDLKPANVLVDSDDRPYVLDFGLARTTGSQTDLTVTAAAHFVGTLQWASPEQAAGRAGRLDLRSDVYALGLMLHHLLTGDMPYDVSGPLPDVILAIRTTEAAPPSARRSGIDDELDTLVLKCLAKEPERRYETAGALARDVRRYLAHEPLDARRDSAWYVIRKRLRRHRLPLAAAATALVALVAFAVVMSVLYRRTADAERESRLTAERLAEQLSQSNIERGRALSLAGSVAAAEDLLWGELFRRVDVQPGVEATDPAFWALVELYARHPCAATFHSAAAPRGSELIAFSSSPPIVTLRPADGRWCRWNADTGEVERIATTTFSGYHRSAGSRPDGRHMLFSLDDAPYLVLADAELGTFAPVSVAPEGRDVHAHLAPDGERFAAFDGESHIRVYSIDCDAVAHEQLRIPAALSTPHIFRFVDGGAALLAGDDNGTLYCWTLDGPSPRLRWERADMHPTSVLGVNSDGSLLAYKQWPQPRIVIVSIRDGAIRTEGRDDYVAKPGRIEFDRTGTRILTIEHNRADITIDSADGSAARVQLSGHRETPVSAVFNSDSNRIASTSHGGVLKLWDLPWADPATRRYECGASIHCVRFEPPSGALWWCGHEGNLSRAEVGMVEARTWAHVHAAAATSFALSLPGDLIATAGHDAALRLWDRADSRLRATLTSPTRNRFTQVTIRPDGRFVAGACEDGIAYVWDVATLEHRALRDHRTALASIAYSSDGRWLASGDRSGELIVRDGETLAIAWRAAAHDRNVRSLAFSPTDGRLVTGGDDRLVKLWDPATGACTGELVGHPHLVFAVAIRPDGRVVASGDVNGAIVVWDVAGRRELLRLAAHANSIYSLAFSPDGRCLASAGEDNAVQVHDFSNLQRRVAGNLEAALARSDAAVAPSRAATLRAWRAATVSDGAAAR